MVPAYRTVAIDCFRDTLGRFASGYAVVAVDVVRAMTTAVSAVALGRRCFAVPTVGAALQRAARLERPLLAGEVGGEIPAGFELGNSPAELARRADVDRPLVLVSSSGTPLLDRAGRCGPTYLGCFRNSRHLGRRLAGRHLRVALDSSPLWGAGRVEDTVNLLGHAVRKAMGMLAAQQGRELPALATAAGAERATQTRQPTRMRTGCSSCPPRSSAPVRR